MWYPDIEIVFTFGTASVQNAKTSVMSRIDGSGG